MQFGPICLINPTTEGVMRCLTVGLSICKWDNFKSCGHFYGMRTNRLHFENSHGGGFQWTIFFYLPCALVLCDTEVLNLQETQLGEGKVSTGWSAPASGISVGLSSNHCSFIFTPNVNILPSLGVTCRCLHRKTLNMYIHTHVNSFAKQENISVTEDAAFLLLNSEHCIL